MLSQEVTVPRTYQWFASGLLGNFNGDASDDFGFRNGSMIDEDSSDRAVFSFGQSWMTTAEESVFVYKKGQSHGNFSHPSFVPVFLDEFDPKLVENATRICGEANMECIFDKVVTGSDLIAADSQYAAVAHAKALKITHNKIPTVNGTKRIELYKGETKYIPVYAYDEGDVTFSLSSGFNASLTNVTGHSAVIELKMPIALGTELSVVVTDNMSSTSAPFVFEIIICSGCTDHGICDFNVYKAVTKKSDPVKYAKCICDGGQLPYWSGKKTYLCS